MSFALSLGPTPGFLSFFALLTAFGVLPQVTEAQDVRSPVQVFEGIAKAGAIISLPHGTAPREFGPTFFGLAPGELPTDETRRLLDLCALETSEWEGVSRETVFRFRAEGDFVLDDGVLVEIQSAVWGKTAVTVEFTSYTTHRFAEGGSEIRGNRSQVLLAPPGVPGGDWALLSWTSESGSPVERPLEPIEEGPQPGGLESEVLVLSAVLAEQSQRISTLEEVIAELRREVQALKGTIGTAAGGPGDDPVFTPYTVAPVVMNRKEVRFVLRKEQQALMAAGVGGTVHVWFLIDEEGGVQRAQLIESSGHPALDAAALNVADVIQFTPALNRDKPVPVWISYPITFTVR